LDIFVIAKVVTRTLPLINEDVKCEETGMWRLHEDYLLSLIPFDQRNIVG